MRFETGLKDQTVDPNDKQNCRNWLRAAIQDSESLAATLDSANMYSATEYDVNIVDTKSRVLIEHVS